MTKRTFQPKTKKARTKHGFLYRMNEKEGRKTISRKRAKGRKRVAK